MSTRRRQGKVVTVTYGGLATVLLVVIAAVALVLQPPAPPAVAEFAPQAADTIDEAPENQSSQFGAGEGGTCAVGQRCVSGTTTTTTPVRRPGKGGTIDRPRVRRCVGDPPRQTEDPQSPPCVNYWEGDNGGATAKGVTADEIRVAIPCLDCEPGGLRTQDLRNFQALADHFNRRYELYGRTIRLFPISTPVWEEQPELQRAAAERAADEYDVFASLTYDHNGNLASGRVYGDELARRGVISTEALVTLRTRVEMEKHRPYLWSYAPLVDDVERSLAVWMCRSLAGGNAVHGGAVAQRQRRKFGVLYGRTAAGAAVDITPLRDGLRACDEDLETAEFEKPFGVADLSRFQADQVTSVVCLCDRDDLEAQMSEATNRGYEPEWLISGVLGQDQRLNSAQPNPYTQAHIARAFGLGPGGKVLLVRDEPWFWAVRESDPDFAAPASSASAAHPMARVYHQLLLLASGIQAAGPRLTAEAFERGLLKLRFPNPGAGAAPYWQPAVGFGPGDRSMVEDYALVWWRAGANSDGTGGLCYIDRGRRWTERSLPQGPQPFFTLDYCR